MLSSDTQCTHTTPTGRIRTKAATLRSYPRHGHMAYLREIASCSCKAWYRRYILPSTLIAAMWVRFATSSPPASSRPCSPDPTLPLSPVRAKAHECANLGGFQKRKPFVALIGFMGFIGVLMVQQPPSCQASGAPCKNESLQICCQNPLRFIPRTLFIGRL